MAIFGVSFKGNKDDRLRAYIFMKDTNKRLQDKNLLNNPFIGKICNIKQDSKNDDDYLILMKPVYPRVYIFGFFTFLGTILFTGLSLWLIPSIVLILMGFFWSKYLFYLVLKIGIKKSGYKGKTRLLAYEDMIEKVSNNLNSV